MTRTLLFTIAVIISSATGISQSPVKTFSVEFILSSPSLNSDSTVYICGNLAQLAQWNPGKIKMTPVGNHKWSFKIYTDSPMIIEYKYTLGSWEREGANDSGSPLKNFMIRTLSDTIIYNTVTRWTSKTEKKITGQVTGTVEYHRQFKGEGIADRDIVVWLPPDYKEKPGKKYPVIYLEDGQNLFDPLTSAFGTDWQVDETCDSLIRNGIIKPVIIVGIYNSASRMQEYTPGEKGDAYMNFIINYLKPFIDSNYRTQSDRKNTFTGGSSAGGTISFMLLWNHSEVFSGAMCLSPAFKIQNIDVIKEVTGYSGKKKNIRLYIDNGGRGLEERLQPGVDEMLKALKQKGFRPGKDYYYISAPDAEHNEAAWAKRMPEALVFLLKR